MTPVEQALQARIADLEQTVLHLRAKLDADQRWAFLMLTRKQRLVLEILYANAPNPVSRATFEREVWLGRKRVDNTLTKTVSVAHSAIADAFGASVTCVYRRGWSISLENKAKIDALIGHRTEPA